MKMIRRVLTHSRSIWLLSLLILPGCIALPAAYALPICPSPTVPEGNACVLNNDVVLTSTLILPSHTTLDCKNHKMTPTSPGTVVDSTTRSTPQVAVFLNGAQGITIQNCDIREFDHGI